MLTTHGKMMVTCPECGDGILLRIPVNMTIQQNVIRAWVDDTASWEQPVWDHQLEKHVSLAD